MTLPEAIEAVRASGAVLVLDDQGPLLRGRVAPEVVGVLRDHRDRVAAILRLRELHRAMGLSEDDVFFVESAILSGKVAGIRVATRAPATVQA